MDIWEQILWSDEQLSMRELFNRHGKDRGIIIVANESYYYSPDHYSNDITIGEVNKACGEVKSLIYTQSGQNRPDNFDNIFRAKALFGKYFKEKC